MTCQEIQNLLHAYIDGELDAAGSLEVERHIRDCAGCRQIQQNLSVLKKAVTANAPYFKAPTNLRHSILSSVEQTVRAETPRTRHWQWNTLTASLAMAACLMLGFFAALLIVPRYSEGKLLVNELTASHVRSLLAAHLMDVVSTDQHTVKPWFDGKIDFAPPVNDLASHGYPLAGGRLDYIGGRTVAVLVYQKQKHFINLFIWPSPPSDKIGAPVSSEELVLLASKNGYNLVNWYDSGMTFWAVSDVNKNDLLDFSHLVENAATPAAH